LFIAKAYSCWKLTFAEQNYCEASHFFRMDSSIKCFTTVYISFSVALHDFTHHPAYQPELLSSRTVSILSRLSATPPQNLTLGTRRPLGLPQGAKRPHRLALPGLKPPGGFHPPVCRSGPLSHQAFPPFRPGTLWSFALNACYPQLPLGLTRPNCIPLALPSPQPYFQRQGLLGLPTSRLCPQTCSRVPCYHPSLSPAGLLPGI
jgi:hypothetical protein